MSSISQSSVQVSIDTWSDARRKHNQHIYSEAEVQETEFWDRYYWQNFAFPFGLQNFVISNNIITVFLYICAYSTEKLSRIDFVILFGVYLSTFCIKLVNYYMSCPLSGHGTMQYQVPPNGDGKPRQDLSKKKACQRNRTLESQRNLILQNILFFRDSLHSFLFYRLMKM